MGKFEHDENSDVESSENESIESDKDSMIDNGTDDSSGDEEITEPEEKINPKKRKFDQFDQNNDDIEDAVSSNKKKKQNKHLFKPPTVEELNRLRETQNLFNSNLFRLQIEEVLKEVNVKLKHQNKFKTWFDKLKSFILSLTDSEQYDLNNREWLNDLKVKLPINLDCRNNAGTYQFLQPKSVQLVGLFNSNCVLGPEFRADVNIEIPEQFFNKRDKLNARYIIKRALYLSHLAAKLSESDLVSDMKFTLLNGNILKPVLQMKPNEKWSKATVQLQLSVECDARLFEKFTPIKQNLRTAWYYGDDTDPESGPPTPFYNSTVLEDLVTLENEKVRYKYLDELNNVKDGLKLLQVWLKQRELDSGFGAFTAELMSMFVVYLLKNRKLNNNMSSYQIIRNVWIALASSNWCELDHGISLCETSNDKQPSLIEFHSYYPVVFVDVTGYYNLACSLNAAIYSKVKKEAELAIGYLDNADMNSFQALFLTKMNFLKQYDQIVNIHCRKALEKIFENNSKDIQLDYLQFKQPLIVKSVLEIVIKGLTNRAVTVVPKLTTIPSWSIDTSPILSIESVVLGIVLDPDNALSVLDKGPEANLPEAREFRDFWGEKSQLRRFQDGSISEAVVWSDGTTVYDKRSITATIITYLLQKHFGVNSRSVNYICNQFDEVLKLKGFKVSFDYGSGEEVSFKAISAFDELAKIVRSLGDLPLPISAVQGISSVLRFTSVYPPVPKDYFYGKKTLENTTSNILLQTGKTVPYYLPSVDGVIHLVKSGKWPDDLNALRRIKAAFHLKLSELLSKKHNINCMANTKYVEIFYEGYVFRLSIGHEKEIALLKKSVTVDKLVQYKDTAESLDLEKTITHIPILTGTLNGLNSQHPSFGSACRLAKRWFSSQLLDASHMPELAIELLTASVYTSPAPFAVPVMPQVAFLRFLYKIAYTDWNIEPIIVNLNDEMEKEQITKIETLFKESRASLPKLFIATPNDDSRSIWTEHAPNELVLLRSSLLARESLRLLETQIYSKHLFKCQILFKPSLSGYDAVIRLKPPMVPRKHHSIDFESDKEHVLLLNKQNGRGKIPITEFDPVQYYLAELRKSYGSFALFFHDTYGGDFIGVLWKPDALQEKEFKVSRMSAHQVVIQDDVPKLKLNTDALLEDFYIIGKDIVQTIDVKGQ